MYVSVFCISGVKCELLATDRFRDSLAFKSSLGSKHYAIDVSQQKLERSISNPFSPFLVPNLTHYTEVYWYLELMSCSYRQKSIYLC